MHCWASLYIFVVQFPVKVVTGLQMLHTWSARGEVGGGGPYHECLKFTLASKQIQCSIHACTKSHTNCTFFFREEQYLDQTSDYKMMYKVKNFIWTNTPCHEVTLFGVMMQDKFWVAGEEKMDALISLGFVLLFVSSVQVACKFSSGN